MERRSPATVRPADTREGCPFTCISICSDTWDMPESLLLPVNGIIVNVPAALRSGIHPHANYLRTNVLSGSCSDPDCVGSSGWHDRCVVADWAQSSRPREGFSL